MTLMLSEHKGRPTEYGKHGYEIYGGERIYDLFTVFTAKNAINNNINSVVDDTWVSRVR